MLDGWEVGDRVWSTTSGIRGVITGREGQRLMVLWEGYENALPAYAGHLRPDRGELFLARSAALGVTRLPSPQARVRG
jgi:hypothetical protein